MYLYVKVNAIQMKQCLHLKIFLVFYSVGQTCISNALSNSVHCHVTLLCVQSQIVFLSYFTMDGKNVRFLLDSHTE